MDASLIDLHLLDGHNRNEAYVLPNWLLEFICPSKAWISDDRLTA
jgi:hypothetical protein